MNLLPFLSNFPQWQVGLVLMAMLAIIVWRLYVLIKAEAKLVDTDHVYLVEAFVFLAAMFTFLLAPSMVTGSAVGLVTIALAASCVLPALGF